MTPSHRLVRKDFAHIPRTARRLSSALFSITWWMDPSQSGQKFSVVVSKKVSIRAVKRNLVKRRFRAAFREIVTMLPPGSLLVLTAKKEALTVPPSRIQAELKRVLAA